MNYSHERQRNRRQSVNLMRPLLLTLSVGLLTGCVTPKHIVLSDYCMIAQPITYTEQDLSCMTEKLARQIERHNWQRETLCDGKQ